MTAVKMRWRMLSKTSPSAFFIGSGHEPCQQKGRKISFYHAGNYGKRRHDPHKSPEYFLEHFRQRPSLPGMDYHAGQRQAQIKAHAIGKQQS